MVDDFLVLGVALWAVGVSACGVPGPWINVPRTRMLHATRDVLPRQACGFGKDSSTDQPGAETPTKSMGERHGAGHEVEPFHLLMLLMFVVL